MEQFDQLLTCAICLDRYRNPKLLPCQHSFCCEPCMDGLVNYVSRQVKCPECRAEHRIPYQGVQGFPTNVTLQRFLELHMDITGELPDPTAGMMMERCSVCSEKSYCYVCAHCDKKCCADCKEAHNDILKREIARVNNQVKRLLHRLKDSLSMIEKNSHQLQVNCNSVSEEVSEVSSRLMKALKDRTEFLKTEIERYMVTEMRTMTTLKENLEQEISNIESNSELADKYITDGTYEWDDVELMDTKETFLKTIEFVRNFEYEVGDYGRRAKFHANQDSGTMIAMMATFGDVHINKPKEFSNEQPSFNPGIMRSKSDHRLATQFRQQEEKYGYGRDNGEGRLSPVRYGGTRRGSYRYMDDDCDYDSEPKPRSRYRSRFARNYDIDSDSETGGRNVKFQEPEHPPKPREKVLDTEDVTRGQLSGVIRLFDSPRVIKKLQETEIKQKKKEKEIKNPPAAPPPKAPPVTQPTRKTQRQVSEEDEITKIKKMNKQQESNQPSAAAAAPTTVTSPTTPKPKSERVSQLSKNENKKPSSEEEEPGSPRRSQPSSPTSRLSPKEGSTPKQGSETGTRSRTGESESPAESDDSGRRRSRQTADKGVSSRKASTGSKTSENEADKTKQTGTGRKASTDETSRPAVQYSRSSSSSSLNLPEENKTTTTTSSRSGRPLPLRRSLSTSSASSDSAESSRRSSPVRNTGAAFSTDELKSRFDSSKPSTRPPSRTGTTDSSSASTPVRTRAQGGRSMSLDSTATGTPRTTGRFQSRFLGRAGTPTVEASKESESSSSESSSSSSDDSSESESEIETKTVKPMARTDIGPLLARSANVRRDEYNYSPRGSRQEEPGTYARSRTSSSLYPGPKDSDRSSHTDYRRDSTAGASSSGTNSYTNRRSYPYSSDKDYLSPRSSSSTGSTYSRYLNRSRPSLDLGDTSSSRYGTYSSRFLNKSKSSAALNNNDQTEGEEEEKDKDTAPPWRISNEERYPSGRSRIAAIKERRARLARSKSSADLGSQEDVSTAGTARSREATPERDGTGSSLSTWARYLKNKYGNRNKERNKSILNRSKSSSSLGGGRPGEPSPDSSEEDKLSPASPTNSISSLSFNTPRAQYMAKKKVLMKIGNRGSDPGHFTWPRGIAVTPDNNIVVADSSNHRVQIFTEAGQFVKEFGSYGNAEAEFDCLAGVAVNRIGQYIIADRYNHRIQVFDPAGRFLRCFGNQGSADGKFSYPWGITTDALGFIYVCDKENHRIQVFQSDGTFVGKFGSIGSRPGQLEHPHYIAVSTTNRVIVSDSNNHRIQIFDVNGKVLTTFGSEGSEEGQFKFPRGVAVDDQGYIFIGDSGNNRIQIFHPDGTFLSAFGAWGSGDGEFKGLEGLAVTSSGKILVCDRENHRIQVF